MSTTDNSIVVSNEQIKNKKSEDVTGFYNQLKIYLEKDQSNFFKTKVSLDIDNKTDATNLQIQKLIDLKVKNKNQVDNLILVRKSLKEKNSKLKEDLLTKLEMNNEN